MLIKRKFLDITLLYATWTEKEGVGICLQYIQDKTFEHPYLQAIGSHTNYCGDEDPNSPMESGGDNSKGESGSPQVHIDSHGWKIAGVIEVVHFEEWIRCLCSIFRGSLFS
ncbi:hypothetical protein WN944_015257 [Citrus x changshan-huyou]|uniref:Uncharacterized protein n=1 Tax=Citrus x changshan-huyou TaxID=2935761 RepID=A0AAP0QQX1_9ROSI